MVRLFLSCVINTFFCLWYSIKSLRRASQSHSKIHIFHNSNCHAHKLESAPSQESLLSFPSLHIWVKENHYPVYANWWLSSKQGRASCHKVIQTSKNAPLAWIRWAMCGDGLIIKRKIFSFATSRCVNWASSSKYILSGFMNFIGERGMWMKSILWKFQLCKLIFIIAQKFIARRFRAFNSDRNVFIKSTRLGDGHRLHRLLVLSSNRNFTAFWYSCLIGQPSQIIIIKLTKSIAKIACNCCWLFLLCHPM